MQTSVMLLDNKFEKKTDLNIDLDLSPKNINKAVVHQVVKALLAGRRQGTAMTKTKGLVRGGGAKPFKQKGTGRARQGSSRSPLQPGGGTVFGPTPRDYSQKINKKVRGLAIHSVLADKFQAGALYVVDDLQFGGKTKNAASFFSGRDIKSALVIAPADRNDVSLSVRNLPRFSCAPSSGFSVYEALKHESLIIFKSELDALLTRLSSLKN